MKWAGSKIILNLSFPPFSLHFINFSPTKQRKILILPYISLSLFPFLPSSLQPNIVFISFYILLIFFLSLSLSLSLSLHLSVSLPPFMQPCLHYHPYYHPSFVSFSPSLPTTLSSLPPLLQNKK